MTQADSDSPSPPVFELACDLVGESATVALATAIATHARTGDVIALSGELGTGKTAFARGFIQALSDNPEEVPSPTFTLVQTYETPNGPVYHFDLYRLNDPDEAIELGIEESFATGMTLIEWPDKLGSYLPADRLDISIAYGSSPEARTITLYGHGTWPQRLRESDLG